MKRMLVFCCFVIVALIAIKACSSDSGKIADLEAQLADTTAWLQAKQNDYDRLLTTHEELRTEYEEYKMKSGTDTSLLERDKRVLESQVDELEKDQAALNSDLIAAHTKMAKLDTSSGSAITSLTAEVGQLQAENDSLNIRVSQLTKELTPFPNHALTWTQVKEDPDLRSAAGYDRYTWQNKVEEIGRTYHANHIYIDGETDCNDMAIDLWNMLLAQEIKSVIVIGVVGDPYPEFNECDHAWLNVFGASGGYVTLEPTTGQVYYSETAGQEDYKGRFFYKKPSDLRSDLMKRW